MTAYFLLGLMKMLAGQFVWATKLVLQDSFDKRKGSPGYVFLRELYRAQKDISDKDGQLQGLLSMLHQLASSKV